MKLLMRYVVVAWLGLAMQVQAEDVPGQVLAEKQGCFSCHGVSMGKRGPAFAAVSKHYANQVDAASWLKEKIRQGGTGVWGTRKMPPQSQLSDEELAALTAWVLGLPQ